MLRDLCLPWDRHSSEGPLADRIAAAAALQIVQHQIEVGDLLTEADLAQIAGSSRTPAREAMLQLEAWGLVRLNPKKGAAVIPVTPAERRELLAVRALFEIHAVRVIAEGREVGAADRLQAHLDDQDGLLDPQHALAFAGSDYAFHAEIIRAGGNDVISSVTRDLGPRLARLTFDAALADPGRVPTLLAEHKQLAALALDGDSQGYRRAIHQHLADGHALTGFAS